MVRSFPEILEFEPYPPEDGDRNLGEIDPLRDATLGVSNLWDGRQPFK